jgi:carbonic anhydrase/acetyltransferase-like protein (isoleucine patch superfamily)
MLLEHMGHMPRVHPTAYVAPNAVLCGDVTVGPDCRVMFGAQLIAEAGTIEIGEQTIVLENAVLRSTREHPLSVGKHCLIGPQTHLIGCSVGDGVFVATGASIFHAARIGNGAEVRINAVVHLKTEVAAGATLPIGWVAVGSPARFLPPDQHEAIWALQAELNFPLTAYGLDRAEADMQKITKLMANRLATHRDDREL